MGVGCGFAIAAAIVSQTAPPLIEGQRSPVFCIQGDSAFGFSGMEIETACRYRVDTMTLSIIVNNNFFYRYKLPIVFIIMNNNGIYRGMDNESWKTITDESEDLGLKYNYNNYVVHLLLLLLLLLLEFQ